MFNQLQGSKVVMLCGIYVLPKPCAVTGGALLEVAGFRMSDAGIKHM